VINAQVLTAIFVANEIEKKLAEQSRRKVVEQFPNEKVITPNLNASTF
jgi:peptide-methionine (S)-S-oxide reductase